MIITPSWGKPEGPRQPEETSWKGFIELKDERAAVSTVGKDVLGSSGRV